MLTCNRAGSRMVVDAANSNGPFQPVALLHIRGESWRIATPRPAPGRCGSLREPFVAGQPAPSSARRLSVHAGIARIAKSRFCCFLLQLSHPPFSKRWCQRMWSHYPRKVAGEGEGRAKLSIYSSYRKGTNDGCASGLLCVHCWVGMLFKCTAACGRIGLVGGQGERCDIH